MLKRDFKDFYLSANGFETNDYLFRIIPIEEIIENKKDTPANELIFAEYLIYSDFWKIVLNADDLDSYEIITYDPDCGSNVAVTGSLFTFIETYLKNNGTRYNLKIS